MSLKPISDVRERALPTEVMDNVEGVDEALRNAYSWLRVAHEKLGDAANGLRGANHPESATYARALVKIAADVEVNREHVKSRHDDLKRRTGQVPERVDA